MGQNFLANIFSDASNTLGDFLAISWPFFIFLILFPLFKSTWMFWRQSLMKSEIKWTFLELKIPREIKKSPQAMEQVLIAMHALRNSASDFRDAYWEGEVTRWFSLELVSFGGEVHFYVRTYFRQRGLVEAAFFSYYPDVEIVEVEDYVNKLPSSIKEMYKQGYDLWGSEMKLRREAAYPIKSYRAFESPAEEKEFDPMSIFLEVLGKLKEGEVMGVQILITPADDGWYKKWEPLVKKLKEPKTKETKGVKDGDKAVASFAKMIARSPGETEVLEAVEKNLSKPAFDTLIRFIYFSPKSIFYDSFARRGLMSAFNQYSSTDLNSLDQNYNVGTMTRFWHFPHFFPKKRNEYRKNRLLYKYRRRDNPTKPFMGQVMKSYIMNWDFSSTRFQMTTESLATLFHPPTYLVLTAPHLERVESRKASPPAGMAIFGDEEAIEKFQ